MASAKIFDKEYPMAYTVMAQSEIAKKFGGINMIGQALSAEDTAIMMENVAFISACLIRGYEDREAVRSHLNGNEFAEGYLPSQHDIMCAMEPKEALAMTKEIMAAIEEGNKVSVEVLPQKGNADATQ